MVLAAFEPFGGRRENQSERVVRELAAAPPRAVEVDVHILPVTFARLPGAVRALVAQPAHALVIVGEASGARGLRLERHHGQRDAEQARRDHTNQSHSHERFNKGK